MPVPYWSLSTGLSRELYDWSAENAMTFTAFSKRLFPTFSCKIEKKKNERIGLNLEGCVFVAVFFFFFTPNGMTSLLLLDVPGTQLTSLIVAASFEGFLM